MKHRACPNEKDRAKWKKYSAEEVARHDNLEDAWVIIYGRVYDITSFAITHPGWNNAGQVSTALAIVRNLGKDCTEEFEYTHSLTAWRQLNDFQIGVLSLEGEGVDDGEAVEHPLPSWLPHEVVNFWKTYNEGLTDQLCKYLAAAGYPQKRNAEKESKESKESKSRIRKILKNLLLR